MLIEVVEDDVIAALAEEHLLDDEVNDEDVTFMLHHQHLVEVDEDELDGVIIVAQLTELDEYLFSDTQVIVDMI